MSNKDNLLHTFEERSVFYGLLARVFNSEVGQELIDSLNGISFPEETESDEINTASRLINSYLKDSHENSVTELAVDFARLFIVLDDDNKNHAYPYESVYTSIEQTLMGDARDAVRSLYKEAGLQTDKDWKLPDDHIAIELEFMKILAVRTINSIAEESDDITKDLIQQQAAFLDNHLLTWVPHFTKRMEEFAHTDFYKGIAKFLPAYLKEDRALLEEVASLAS